MRIVKEVIACKTSDKSDEFKLCGWKLARPQKKGYSTNPTNSAFLKLARN